jgi:lipoprotein NlpI
MAKTTDSAEIQYLKQDKIGKVIAQGLSQLYQEKPQKPVTYLAHWLLTYSENMKKTEAVEKLEQTKVQASKTFHTS